MRSSDWSSDVCSSDLTDIPWPKAYVDARARVGVDCQYVTLSEALDQFPGAPELYIQKPQCWNGNNLIWLKPDGQFSSDLRKAAVEIGSASCRERVCMYV